MQKITPRKRIIILDGPGGPHLGWVFMHLKERYDITVFWRPADSPEEDDFKAAYLDGKCVHFPVTDDSSLVPAVVDWGRYWQAAGILSFSDLTLTQAQAAAEQLGLPANPAASVAAARDKFRQRQCLLASGVPVPRFQRVQTSSDLQSALDHTGLPAILKPVDGLGSLAVAKIGDRSDALDIWEAVNERYRNDPNGRRTEPEFILEEFLVGHSWHADPRYGSYVSVESLVQDGTITHLAVNDKGPLEPGFRETAQILPTALPDHLSLAMTECAAAAITSLGLANTAVHTEIMMTRDGPRVIEVNARVGGAVAEQMHFSSQYDVVDAIASIAVGDPIPQLTDRQFYCAHLTPQAPALDVPLASAPTRDELLSVPGVVFAMVLGEKGSILDWRQGTDGGTLAHVFAKADSSEKLLELAAEIGSSKYFPFAETSEIAVAAS
jgi:biotin carboxylase